MYRTALVAIVLSLSVPALARGPMDGPPGFRGPPPREVPLDPALRAEREAELLEWVQQQSPERHARLLELRRLRPEAYRHALRKAAGAHRMADRDPEAFEMRHRSRELRAEIGELREELKELPRRERAEAREDLEDLAGELFDLRIALEQRRIEHRQARLEEMEARIGEARTRIEEEAAARDEHIERIVERAISEE
ncbi:MAG: hypothetical protein JRI25_00880 [Deltaproteobacteria bacterium]|nr:hypothetical protein [Deltaproteobacteria bacterium]MBW2253132.1 hypothetical protein [Deltaproteobacteria bacterium]